ncbi:MAG: hypothetical protein ACRDP1_15730 [Nocardioidaceae bacterium]
MGSWLPLLAAFGCALCNGVAAVLQKVSADREAPVTTLRNMFLWRLLHHWPYLTGIALDTAGWVLTLVAVHSLPLFVVQPIIAFGVVVTLVTEWVVFHRRLGLRTVAAIALIAVGLGLLTSGATVQTASRIHGVLLACVVLTPLLLGTAAAGFTAGHGRSATAGLAAIAGLAFGGTAVAGRLLRFPTPYWHILFNPLAWALLGYGLVGIAAFTIALQRHRASVVNASLISFETLAPIAFGITFLGDRPKTGSSGLVILGAAIAVTGTVVIAASRRDD